MNIRIYRCKRILCRRTQLSRLKHLQRQTGSTIQENIEHEDPPFPGSPKKLQYIRGRYKYKNRNLYGRCRKISRRY